MFDKVWIKSATSDYCRLQVRRSRSPRAKRTLERKMSFIGMKMKVQVNTFSNECFRGGTYFDTEARVNLEMAARYTRPLLPDYVNRSTEYG